MEAVTVPAIKASDLRIGNAVTWDAANEELTFIGKGFVYEIHKEYCAVELNGNRARIGCKYLRPIPLTPELLERCGFENYEVLEDEPIDLKLYLPSALLYANLSWIREDQSVMLIDGDASRVGRPIKYLHQLQNLYFALTGEELQITF
jgi:hypothetical protein